MAKTVKFSGSSDDNVCWEGPGVTDGVDSYDATTFLRVAGGGEELFVVARYCPGPSSGWMLGVCRSVEDDDVHLPAWPMRFERDPRTPYSPFLVIECPDDVTITPVDDKGRRTSLDPAAAAEDLGKAREESDRLKDAFGKAQTALDRAAREVTNAKTLLAQAAK